MNNRIENIVKNKDFYNNIGIEEKDMVYLSGSLVEGNVDPFGKGIGNEYSDIDVFILRNTPEFMKTEGEYNENGKKTFFSGVGEESLDIEVYDLGVIREIASTIINTDIKPDVRLPNAVAFPEGWDVESVNSFLTRFLYSYQLTDKTQFDGLIPQNVFNKFAEIYRLFIVNLLYGLQADVQGNMCNNEQRTALLLARSYCMLILKYILYSNNEFVAREKWVWIKFCNLVKSKEKYSWFYKKANLILFSEIDIEKINEEIVDFLKASERVIEDELCGGLLDL